MNKLKQNYQSLDPDERSGVWWGVAAIAAIAALAILDSSLFPGVQTALERFPRIVGLASGALGLIAAFSFILTGKAMRTRRVNQAVTSVGLAGLVRPLLGVEYVISGILEGRTASLVATKEAYEVANGKRSPLKWTRGLILDAPPPLDANCQDPNIESTAIIGTQFNLTGADLDAARRLVDECIREVVGSVRNWTDTLVLTELGQQSLFSIQSLRSDLQLAEYLLRKLQGVPKSTTSAPASATTNSAPEAEATVMWMLSVLRDRVLFLATAFELASMPRNVRREVVQALSRWPGANHTRPKDVADNCQLAAPDVVADYLRYLGGRSRVEPAADWGPGRTFWVAPGHGALGRKVAGDWGPGRTFWVRSLRLKGVDASRFRHGSDDPLIEPAGNAFRQKRRQRAEGEIERFYLTQDQAKVKSNTQ